MQMALHLLTEVTEWSITSQLEELQGDLQRAAGVLRNQTVEDMPHVEEAIRGVMIETASVGPEVNKSGNGEGPLL